MKKKRVILVGKSASGKDHARKICQEYMGMKYAISYTTRPPRANEVHGQDYFFISDSEFYRMIDEDEWYEYVVFNNWFYGTTREQMNQPGQVFIFTPSGLSQLLAVDRKESLVIYFDIHESIRKERMYLRQGNADSVSRRLEADEKDFADFTDYDIHIQDPNYEVGKIVEIIRENMATKISA